MLLDIGLPGMDGYAVAARLREAGHDRAALVALTGYGQDEDLRRSSRAGFDHHLVKPVDVAALRRLIAEVAGRACGVVILTCFLKAIGRRADIELERC